VRKEKIMARRKINQITVDKVHALKKDGVTAPAISKKLKLPLNTVNYILYQKKPSYPKAQLAKALEPGLNELFGTKQKPLDELYAEADKAMKEADSVLKRVKRLLFGS